MQLLSIFKYISVLLIFISGQTFSQEEMQHARDGYSHKINGFFPEIRLNSTADISVGAGLSYKFGQISSDGYKSRNNILELTPGVDFSIYPENIHDFNIKTAYKIGIPLKAGMGYHYISDFDNLNASAFELFAGYSLFNKYTSRFAYFNFLLGYNLYLNKSKDFNGFPLRISLVVGFK